VNVVDMKVGHGMTDRDEAQEFREEIDAASFSGIAAHLREIAENIANLRGNGIDSRIRDAINAANAKSRDGLRSASRTFQEFGDEYRRQRGL